jgi:hypothetical protein
MGIISMFRIILINAEVLLTRRFCGTRNLLLFSVKVHCPLYSFLRVD